MGTGLKVIEVFAVLTCGLPAEEVTGRLASFEAAAATLATMALLASLRSLAILSSLPFWPYGNPAGPSGKVGFGRSSAIRKLHTLSENA